MIIQFGRGRQSWGAGNDIQLAISEYSNSYDYGMLGLDFGKLNVRYFHGYLETDTLSFNRYITGRGIEWNNGKSFLFGLSELIIYSGHNRFQRLLKSPKYMCRRYSKLFSNLVHEHHLLV